jgi:hypothetical protein
MLARMRMEMQINLSRLHSAKVEDFSNKKVFDDERFWPNMYKGLGVILGSVMVWIET